MLFRQVLELTKKSLEFTQNQLVEEINKVKTDIKTVEKNIKDIDEDLLDPDHVSAKLVEFEDSSRQINFCIDGLLETPNDTWEACEDKVQELIQTRLVIEREVKNWQMSFV